MHNIDTINPLLSWFETKGSLIGWNSPVPAARPCARARAGHQKHCCQWPELLETWWRRRWRYWNMNITAMGHHPSQCILSEESSWPRDQQHTQHAHSCVLRVWEERNTCGIVRCPDHLLQDWCVGDKRSQSDPQRDAEIVMKEQRSAWTRNEWQWGARWIHADAQHRSR